MGHACEQGLILRGESGHGGNVQPRPSLDHVMRYGNVLQFRIQVTRKDHRPWVRALELVPNSFEQKNRLVSFGLSLVRTCPSVEGDDPRWDFR